MTSDRLPLGGRDAGQPFEKAFRGAPVYTGPMDAKRSVEMPGIEFVLNRRGEKKAVLIDLKKHGSLWEDIHDAYVVGQRQREPRESIAKVRDRLQRRS